MSSRFLKCPILPPVLRHSEGFSLYSSSGIGALVSLFPIFFYVTERGGCQPQRFAPRSRFDVTMRYSGSEIPA